MEVKKPGRNSNLLSAISEYLATNLDALISVKDLLEHATQGTGSRDIEQKYNSVEHTLSNHYGYNRRAIIDALSIIHQYNEKIEY